MSGPAPKENRRRRNAPLRGEMRPTPGVGWQHGPVPEAPDGLLAPSRDAWSTWMASWFAANWTPSDLPGLRVVVKAYDAVERGQDKANDRTSLIRLMDTYGITPAGQQARRWAPPKGKAENEQAVEALTSTGRYAHLRAV